MKKIITLFSLIALFQFDAKSQENFGHTLNIGVGAGYYGYYNHSSALLNINYEFNVAKNFTLAPSVSVYTYRNEYYWNNKNYPQKYYRYTETFIPVGLKGTYYFDDILKANSDWDFYLGATAGFTIINSRWEDGYYGDKNVYADHYYRRNSPVFLGFHIGAEYHVNSRIGLYLDISNSVSTFGIAIH